MAQPKAWFVKGKGPVVVAPGATSRMMWRLGRRNARVAAMRKSVVVAAGLIGFSVVIGVLVAARQSAPPPAPVESAANAAIEATAPDTHSAATPAPAATPSAPAMASAPASAPAPPPRPAASDLPTVAVMDHPIHAVPEDEPLIIPSVTFVDRNGRERRTEQIVLAPPAPAPASPAMPAFFSGMAQVAGGASLAVAGRPVRLFGVRLADPRDRCGLGPGDARSCAEVARDMLAQRLKRYPDVSCHVPPGQRGAPAAVCIDSSGTDLGGFLVAEGFALADTKASYEYSGSEGVARSFRRGLWHSR